MPIRFKFDLSKALHSMTYIIDRLGATDKVKLIKLLYIADREHFLHHGHPITGDRQCAMPHGPVPSECLRALDGDLWPNPEAAFVFLHVDDHRVMLKAKPEDDWLTAEEKQTIDLVLEKHGATPTWTLRNLTHKFPEYEEVNVEGTSTTIPYEIIMRHHGGEKLFRNGRPVVTEAMAARMLPSFAAKSDADL